jgi:hypothetical protein
VTFHHPKAKPYFVRTEHSNFRKEETNNGHTYADIRCRNFLECDRRRMKKLPFGSHIPIDIYYPWRMHIYIDSVKEQNLEVIRVDKRYHFDMEASAGRGSLTHDHANL